MIPLKNKKKSLEFTVSEIRDFSLKYIEKYAPSKQQLRTYLLKKYLKSGSTNMKKDNYQNLIDIVLSDLEQSKFINDQFYSESKAKNLIQRGSSINKIRSYLISKGVKDKFVKETLDNSIFNENPFQGITIDQPSTHLNFKILSSDGNEDNISSIEISIGLSTSPSILTVHGFVLKF